MATKDGVVRSGGQCSTLHYLQLRFGISTTINRHKQLSWEWISGKIKVCQFIKDTNVPEDVNGNHYWQTEKATVGNMFLQIRAAFLNQLTILKSGRSNTKLYWNSTIKKPPTKHYSAFAVSLLFGQTCWRFKRKIGNSLILIPNILTWRNCYVKLSIRMNFTYESISPRQSNLQSMKNTEFITFRQRRLRLRSRSRFRRKNVKRKPL